MRNRRAPKRLLGLFLGTCLVCVVLAGVIVLTRPAWSEFLFSVTGEETLGAQIRGGLEWMGNITRPQPQTADFVPVAHAGVNPFGVNTFLEQEVEPQKRELAIQMIADAGFHWIRQEFPWEDIEIHGKGDYEDRRHEPYRSAWEKYDHIVDLAEQYDLEIIARLSNPPAWSRAQGDDAGAFAPPDDLADYGDFVEAIVRRYQGRIQTYQIWNEPNIHPEWGNQPVDPEGYTKLLGVGYTRVKAVCPECIVVSGALAQTIPLGPRDLNDFVFLQRMYDAGASQYFDVLAVQGYGLWSGPTDRRMRPRVLNFSRPLYIREIMVQNGDGDKPIWITEMNWNAPPADMSIKPFGYVTLEQQARYAVLAYQRAQREWPWLGVVSFWFFKRATDTEQDQPMYYFRMVEPDFTPMPVYDALKTYIHSEQARVLYPGVYQEDHWALSYQGSWESQKDPSAELGAVRYTPGDSPPPSSTLQFTFEGTDLWLRTGQSTGALAVLCSVDGSAEKEVAVGSGGAQEYRLARALSRTTHTVSIRAKSGPLAVDSITIRMKPRVTPWVIAGGIILVFGLMLALVLGRGPRQRRWFVRRRTSG